MSANPAVRAHSFDAPLEEAPCGFITFSDDGTVRRANRTLLEQLGYDAADVIGSHIDQIMTVGTRIFYQTHWFPMLRLHGSVDEIFLMLRSSSSEHLGMLVNARRREEAGIALYDCVFMRVVERQKYEEELLHARKGADLARADADQKRDEVQEVNEQLVAQTAELKRVNEGLAQALRDLGTSQLHLKHIQEVLPFCMDCGHVKGDGTTWGPVIDYLKSNDIFLSHGYCPECYERIMMEMDREEREPMKLE